MMMISATDWVDAAFLEGNIIWKVNGVCVCGCCGGVGVCVMYYRWLFVTTVGVISAWPLPWASILSLWCQHPVPSIVLWQCTNTHTYTHTHTHTHTQHTHTHTHTHTFCYDEYLCFRELHHLRTRGFQAISHCAAHAHTHVHTHKLVHTHTHTHTHPHSCTLWYVCTKKYWI